MVATVLVIASLASFADVQWPENDEPFHINPPQHSHYLTFGLGSLWLNDPGENDRIWRIDPSTGAVQGHVDSYYGGGIAFDGQYLWKAAHSSPVIRRIRTTDGSTVSEIPGVGSQQTGLAWDGTHLWIADQSTETIYRLDPSNGAQVRAFSSPGPYPRGLVWWNGYLYHSDSHEATIYQLDPANGEVVSKIAAPGDVPRGLAFDGRSFWYSDLYGGIDRMVINVDSEGHIVRSTPCVMIAEVTYSITNTSDSPIEDLGAYWAAPKLDAEHEIVKLTYDPVPDEYVYDDFDRKIAHFCFPPLAPGSRQEMSLSIYERIWRVNYQIDPAQVAPLSAIPQGVRDLYLIDDDALEITHPDIVAAAVDAIGEETNPYRMAVKLHDYVAQHMVYEYPHNTAWNAVSVLNEGRGDCSCYSLLFMALGRAVGLPTRAVNSVFYDEDEDKVFTHWWPEAYIPDFEWIPFDPTGDDRSPLRDRYVGCEPRGITFPENGGTDDTYLGWSSWSWRTGGVGGLTDSTKSGWPPLRVSDLSVSPGDPPSSINLTWTNPPASDLHEVVVQRRADQNPASRNDGVTVHQNTAPAPNARETITDEDVAPEAEYFYAVFSQSATGVWRGIVESGANAGSAVASSSATSAVFRADADGDLYADGSFCAQALELGSADAAEWVGVSGQVEIGDVLALDPTHPLGYRRTSTACSSLIAGVVSSQPGVALGRSSGPGAQVLLALVGIVPVRVTDEGGSIQPGDLLVSSSTPGHAMRWAGPGPFPCALVGKALEPMTENEGLVLVLLTAH